MKVLVLVQSIEEGNYKNIIQLQKDTWNSIAHENVETLFYIPSENKRGIEGDNLYIRESLAWDLMYVHFMKACVEALTLDWDYIFKTDNSTYVNKKELFKVLETKPRTNYYGGHPFFKTHPELNTPAANAANIEDFMWGDGYVLSRDLVVKLVEKYVLNPYYLRAPDDYCVSFVLRLDKSYNEDPTLLIPGYYDKDFSILPEKHVYRCIPSGTNADLNYDDCVKAMKEIHQKLTE